MSTPTKPTLEDVSSRNQAVKPERVQQMQEAVKRLQDRGLLQPPKYGLQPGLAHVPHGTAAAHGTRMMNRVCDND